MSDHIELFSDGDGLAVIGDPTTIDLFLSSHGFGPAPSSDLDLQRLSDSNAGGASLALAGAFAEATSGRWVKLTAESAEAMSRIGLTPTDVPGISHAMLGAPGEIQQWLQISTGASTVLTNPVMLVSLASVLQQRALQQQLKVITTYLAAIDEKVDDVLRSQKDAVFADFLGAELVVSEAMTVRESVGSASDVIWSKVQGTTQTIAGTQAYALRQLQHLSDRFEKKRDIGEVAKTIGASTPEVREWLAVIARCVQLQDSISILELDRVLGETPEEMDRHRLGLTETRASRLELLDRRSSQLLDLLGDIVDLANQRVLLNPFDAPAAVRATNELAEAVLIFRDYLDIENTHETGEAKRWRQAAREVRRKIAATGADGFSTAKRIGGETVDVFRSVDIDGDGIPDRPRIAIAADEAGGAIKGAAAGMASAFATLKPGKRKELVEGSRSNAALEASMGADES